MKTKRYIRLGVVVLLLAVLLSVIAIFVIPAVREGSRDKKNKEVIEAVVKQVLTCPNDELIGLYTDMYERIASELDSLENHPPKPEESITFSADSKITDKLNKMYGPYFTVNGYEIFQQRFLLLYFTYSTALEYSITMDDIEITRSDTIQTNYSFTAYISHGAEDGEQQKLEIGGSAQFYEEEGRLSYLQFLDRELSRELWGKGPSLPESNDDQSDKNIDDNENGSIELEDLLVDHHEILETRPLQVVDIDLLVEDKTPKERYEIDGANPMAGYIYQLPGISYITIEDEYSEHLYYVILTDDTYSFRCGLTTGMTKEEVIQTGYQFEEYAKEDDYIDMSFLNDLDYFDYDTMLFAPGRISDKDVVRYDIHISTAIGIIVLIKDGVAKYVLNSLPTAG